MRKILQIVFCVLACASAAACIFIFIYFEYWGFICLGGTALFAALMLLAKNGLPRNRKEPKTDFMNTEEENEKIREELAARKDDSHTA